MTWGPLLESVSQRATPIITDAVDADELMEAIVTTGLRPIHVMPLHGKEALHARLDVIPPRESVGFVRMRWAVDALVVPSEPDPDRYLFAVNLGTRASFTYGDDDVLISSGEFGVVPPHRPFRTETARDFDQLFMVVDRSELERVAGAFLGRDSGVLEFDYRTDIRPIGAELSQILAAAVMLSTDADFPSVLHTLRKLQAVAVEAALLSSPSFRSRLPAERPAHGRVVRQAMAYVDANLRLPLGVVDIADHVRVSPRALQLAFKKETGMSPLRWVRMHRLAHARAALSAPGARNLRITDVAADAGFFHMGDFSRRYVEQYGETPSVTRGRAADR
ncbi:AraC family transcriptional regulator [Streptomyces sp. AC495_CC817]|uniref:helix-turn-helix transcriptional regulator n=1 Tax=Streptomyces sp. AC495_CC817 TaxID=2823900 RepID=UPI001C270AC6|nr:helix-turn-helix domain-containing protein [Streptomyces sp. AC495_CC817]